MGRFAKNTVFDSGNYALGLPATSSSFRPNVAGFTSQTALRYSTSSDKLEYYSHTGNVYQTVANVGSGSARITKDSFNGTGSATEFGPMSFAYYPGWEANVLVHVGTVYQIPGDNYTFYGNTTIHLLSAPGTGDAGKITIIHGLNSTIAS
jgi:hypothetical protein